MLGRQVSVSALLAVLLAVSSWAQSTPASGQDRGKYVPPPPRPVSKEPELRTGRPVAGPDGQKANPKQDPKTPAPTGGTVQASPGQPPSPQSGLLTSSS